MFLQMQHFCFPDLSKENLCSILIFGNVCFNIVVRINQDNVASMGGCWTYSHHCQIADKNPSKRWNGKFRGFRICIGWISTTGFCIVGFYVPDKIQSLFFRLPRQGLPRLIYTPRTITPRAITLYHHCTAITPVYIYPGYHAIV